MKENFTIWEADFFVWGHISMDKRVFPSAFSRYAYNHAWMTMIPLSHEPEREIFTWEISFPMLCMTTSLIYITYMISWVISLISTYYKEDQRNFSSDPRIFVHFVISMCMIVGPWPIFEETLVVFDHFWHFDRLVEDGVPRRSKDHEISLTLWACGTKKGF